MLKKEFRLFAWLPVVILLMTGSASLAEEIDPDMGVPVAPGAEETYYTCSACHSFRLVEQQGLSKSSWKDTIQWMVDDQEMEPMEPEDYKLVLEYLAKYYGTDRLALEIKKQKQ